MPKVNSQLCLKRLAKTPTLATADLLTIYWKKAKMAQANRLMKMDFDMITDKDLTTIIADDIEMPKGKIEEKVIKIDFCA